LISRHALALHSDGAARPQYFWHVAQNNADRLLVDCWLKTAPSAESIFLATVNLINEDNARKAKQKENTANRAPIAEEPLLYCRASTSATRTPQISTSDGTLDPWKAIAQLYGPNRNNTVAIMGYQLPEVLPNQMLAAPKELNPFCESGLTVFLTPEFYFSGVIMRKIQQQSSESFFVPCFE
jgi:hypothetical protein